MYRFRDIANYLSKVADFNPSNLHLAPPQGLNPVEFYRLVTDRQTRTDRQTYKQTQGHSIYRASITSRGKCFHVLTKTVTVGKVHQKSKMKNRAHSRKLSVGQNCQKFSRCTEYLGLPTYACRAGIGLQFGNNTGMRETDGWATLQRREIKIASKMRSQ